MGLDVNKVSKNNKVDLSQCGSAHR